MRNDFGVITRRLNGVPSRPLEFPSEMSRFSEFSGHPKNFVNSVRRPIGKIAIVTSVCGNPALMMAFRLTGRP